MRWWNAYWFRPAPYVDLAMVRILIVGCLLCLLLRPAFGAAHFESLWALPDAIYDPLTLLRIFLLPWGGDYRPSPAFMQIVHYVTLVAGVTSLIGFRTNVSMAVLTLGYALMVAYIYSHGDYHHPEAPLVITLGVLALSPAGHVLSLDRWLKRRRHPAAKDVLREEGALAGWPLRLVQWLFVLMYASAVLSKLVFHSGPDWLNGYTLQFHLIHDTLRWGTLLGGWLAQHHVLVMLAQYAVVTFQATFVLAVIFPRLRWIYVPLGLGFHIGNWVFLGAFFPEWIVLYVVFIPWQWLLSRLRRRTPAVVEPRVAA